jgi:tetratricopeptide (TPR) repeat protein
MRMFYTHLASCLALTSAVALGWTTSGLAGDTAPASPGKNLILAAAKESPSPGKTPEGAAAKIDKQLTALQEQFAALSTEESQTLMKTLMAKKTAMDSGKIEDANKVRDEIAKGKIKADWRDYRQVLTASAQQWEVMAQKFARLSAQLKPLELDRDKASSDAQAQIDTLGKRLADKRRSLNEHAGNCYYDAAEFKKALPIFTAIYQEIPEDKRAAEKTLTAKLADLCDKTGDPKSALRLYEATYKAASEQDRKSWTMHDVRNRIAAIYEKAGDFKAALGLYKVSLENFAPEKRDTDGKWLKDKVAALETKLGQGQATPAGSKGNTTKRGGH